MAVRKRYRFSGGGVRFYDKFVDFEKGQAYVAQKDLAGGKKTLKAYYWKICGEEYDQQHG